MAGPGDSGADDPYVKLEMEMEAAAAATACLMTRSLHHPRRKPRPSPALATAGGEGVEPTGVGGQLLAEVDAPPPTADPGEPLVRGAVPRSCAAPGAGPGIAAAAPSFPAVSAVTITLHVMSWVMRQLAWMVRLLLPVLSKLVAAGFLLASAAAGWLVMRAPLMMTRVAPAPPLDDGSGDDEGAFQVLDDFADKPVVFG